MSNFSKDYDPCAPADTDYYMMDWTGKLGNGFTIANVVSVVVTRSDNANTDLLVYGAPIMTNTTVTVALTGGTDQILYTVAQTISTSDGRELTRSAKLFCGKS